MILKFRTKRGKSAIINTAEGIYTYGDKDESADAAGEIIRLSLSAHSSVVVFAKKPDYYHYIKDAEPAWMATFTPESLFNEIRYPWLTNLSDTAKNAMKECMESSGQGRDLVFLKGKTDSREVYPKPSLNHCFYQIHDRGSKKERVLSETLLTGILTELAYRESAREVVVVYEAPFHPFTGRALAAITDASEQEVSLIGMYVGDGNGYDKGRYGLTYRKDRLMLKVDGKETEIKK